MVVVMIVGETKPLSLKTMDSMGVDGGMVMAMVIVQTGWGLKPLDNLIEILVGASMMVLLHIVETSILITSIFFRPGFFPVHDEAGSPRNVST